MNRSKSSRTALVRALLVMPLAGWLATAAYAQMGVLTGIVSDAQGKPLPDATLAISKEGSGKSVDVTTDSRGHYSMGGLTEGAFDIDVKVKDAVICQTGVKVSPGSSPSFDINVKDLTAQNRCGNVEADKARAEAEKNFAEMKTHYDAGLQAITAMKAAQAQLPGTPKEQQAPIQDKINQSGGTAVTELTAALNLMKPDEGNRSIVLSRLGEAYDAMGKWQEASDAYQKSIALKPDVAANYNNLGNDLAKLGKIDDAKAAYEKYVALNPNDAALAWRNFGISLYQANRMKEAVEPLQKATTLDPKNPQAWYLLGVALVNTMTFKQDGDKITPVMQPGTVEAYQKAIELDPNGPIGAQAKQGLEQLQAMGVGIDTKVGSAPPPSKGKK